MCHLPQIHLDSVIFRYQRLAQHADCSAHQANLRTVLSKRYGDMTARLLPSGALLLAASGTVSATLELQSYGRSIG